MTASTQDHSPPSPAGSSASDGSSNSVSTGPPHTPVSTSLPLAMPTFMNFTCEDTINGIASIAAAGGVKRQCKTTRRVNTAERRATHNAVERQRRETLNGRFLDLAALLSNLNQIRRPSKSAIVNSSIAHLNASRRHRILAAQQLRMMKNEADALRHEVNEWRARANMPFVDEPMRSDAFSIVIRGELEFEAGDMVDMEEAEDGEESSGSNGGVYGGRQYVGEPAAYTEEPVDYSLLQRQQQEHSEMIAHAQMLPPFGHTVLHPSAPSRPVPHPAGYPMNPAHHQAQVTAGHYYTPSPGVVNPAIAPYENPAIGYDHQAVIQQDMGAKWAMEKRQQILHAQQMRQGSW